MLSHHQCRPQSPYYRAARPGIPTSGHAPRGPLEDTSDRWWAAITRRHVLHSCRVTSLVFNSTCSDSTYAGHHLLRPLLTTMLVLKKQNIKTLRRCVENAQTKTKNTKHKKQSPWWDGETDKICRSGKLVKWRTSTKPRHDTKN